MNGFQSFKCPCCGERIYYSSTVTLGKAPEVETSPSRKDSSSYWIWLVMVVIVALAYIIYHFS